MERNELIDDSVIVEFAENKYRLKIPVDYIYKKLVINEFLKEHRGMDRQFKKVFKGSSFGITVTYPNTTPAYRRGQIGFWKKS